MRIPIDKLNKILSHFTVARYYYILLLLFRKCNIFFNKQQQKKEVKIVQLIGLQVVAYFQTLSMEDCQGLDYKWQF